MKKFYTLVFSTLVFLLISYSTSAQTTLVPGDIAVFGVATDNPDDFHFVFLIDVEVGTEIRFTDSGVMADGTFRASEGAQKYTAPTAISAGTVISFVTNASDFAVDNDADVGLNGLNLSTSGDQIIAFQGASTSPSFIFAVSTDATVWQADATSSNNSALPPGLTNGLTAVAVGQNETGDYDNAWYNINSLTAVRNVILASICNNSNWTGDFTSYTAPSLAVTILVDLDPPVWAASYPTMTNTSAYGVDLTVNLNETGMVYFMVILDGETAPSSAEVKAGVDYADVTPTYPDNFNYLVADADQLFPLWGATPATAYDIYVVAEDPSGNLQSVPVKFDITTTSLGIMITSPQKGETYNTGQTIDFTWNSVGVSNIFIGGYNFSDMDYFFVNDDGSGNPVPIDASLGTYEFTIPNDAPFDSIAIIMWDASNMTLRDSVAPIYMADALPPEIDEIYPLNNAVNVAASYTLEIYFIEPVFTGTGKIYIKDEAGTVFEDFDIAAAGAGQALEFVWNNYGITINPSSDLLAGTKYYVEMDAGVVKDYFDNDFAGISGSTTWAFTIAGTMAVDNEIESAIKVYPVPVSTELTISNLVDLKYVEIMDLTGSKVFSSKQIDYGEYKIDVSTLPKGIYFIKLETSTNLYTRKFIKQ